MMLFVYLILIGLNLIVFVCSTIELVDSYKRYKLNCFESIADIFENSMRGESILLWLLLLLSSAGYILSLIIFIIGCMVVSTFTYVPWK